MGCQGSKNIEDRAIPPRDIARPQVAVHSAPMNPVPYPQQHYGRPPQPQYMQQQHVQYQAPQQTPPQTPPQAPQPAPPPSPMQAQPSQTPLQVSPMQYQQPQYHYQGQQVYQPQPQIVYATPQPVTYQQAPQQRKFGAGGLLGAGAAGLLGGMLLGEMMDGPDIINIGDGAILEDVEF
eukprot:Blabericola_migrator_1__12645@NODE_806_length_6438_cov_127_513734_g571_i0_p2_GENE_NODE_806_length_6438_cov_127_513734_g571_i0NODE_806_length_6438_cov_127_513734_g571_i0_p2_ORF_typecomplete_len178_score32_66_NODE_806_length_6438_cov_127_513734_g571_i029133446